MAFFPSKYFHNFHYICSLHNFGQMQFLSCCETPNNQLCWTITGDFDLNWFCDQQWTAPQTKCMVFDLYLNFQHFLEQYYKHPKATCMIKIIDQTCNILFWLITREPIGLLHWSLCCTVTTQWLAGNSVVTVVNCGQCGDYTAIRNSANTVTVQSLWSHCA